MVAASCLHCSSAQVVAFLLDPFPDERTVSYEVTTAVNNSCTEGPELVEPIGTDQSGLEESG